MRQGIVSDAADLLRFSAVLNRLEFWLWPWIGKIGNAGATALADALKVNAVLNELVLCSSEIGCEGAAALANALKVNAVLTGLHIGWNKIGDSGATALAGALKVNAVLNNLDLQSNSIGEDGATALAEALKVNAVLTNLDLRSCGIGHTGATALAEALKVNAVLKNLSIAHNANISGEAAKQLAAAVLDSKTLEVLSEVPIKELREDTLTELDLDSKGLGDTEASVLAELTKFSAVLNTMSLEENNITDDGKRRFRAALEQRSAPLEVVLGLDSSDDSGSDDDGSHD